VTFRSSSQAAATCYYQSNHSKRERIRLSALPKDKTSELAGLSSSHYLFFMLNIKQESCEYQLLNYFGLTRPENRTQVNAYEVYAQTILNYASVKFLFNFYTLNCYFISQVCSFACLFAKLPGPENSEVTLAVFEASCHLSNYQDQETIKGPFQSSSLSCH